MFGAIEFLPKRNGNAESALELGPKPALCVPFLRVSANCRFSPLPQGKAPCHKAREMTNQIAFGLGLFLIAAFTLDYALGLGVGLFLARRLLDLITLLAFWR